MKKLLKLALSTNCIFLYQVLTSMPTLADCPTTYFLSLEIDRVSSCERQHLMTLGAGIASPSTTSTFGENPAGFIYNYAFKTLVSVVKFEKGDTGAGALGGAVAHGTGKMGGGLGFHQITRKDSSDTREKAFVVSYGMATEVPFLNASIGARLNQVNGGRAQILGIGNLPRTSLDLGAIVNPKGNFRLGAILVNALDDDRAIGAGGSIFLGSHFAIALDSTIRPDGTGGSVRPAIAMSWDRFQFTIGNGFDLDDHGEVWIQEDLMIGFGLGITKSLRLLMYFNRIEHFYAGLNVVPF